jgi:hypothetical protein
LAAEIHGLDHISYCADPDLCAFQFSFLPYHSHLVTWTHRFLIAMELAGALVLWPLVLDARRDFKWTELWVRLERTASLPARIFRPKDRRYEWGWRPEQIFPMTLCVLVVITSLILSSFPGEPHLNLLTGHAWSSVQCKRSLLDFMGLRVDRLVLPRVNIVDGEKLEKIRGRQKKLLSNLFKAHERKSCATAI